MTLREPPPATDDTEAVADNEASEAVTSTLEIFAGNNCSSDDDRAVKKQVNCKILIVLHHMVRIRLVAS